MFAVIAHEVLSVMVDVPFVRHRMPYSMLPPLKDEAQKGVNQPFAEPDFGRLFSFPRPCASQNLWCVSLPQSRLTSQRLSVTMKACCRF